jgi:putative transposase
LVSQPFSKFGDVPRYRTYRYLLQPTSRQRTGLEAVLRVHCELYNAALEERRGAWAWERRSVSYVDQTRTLTELRALRPEVLACGVTVCRGTLQRLDRAFAAFYRRCRAGEQPGFPRFKSARRFDSVQWEDTDGWRLKTEEGRLYLYGIGHLKVRLHRPLRGTPKAITVRREGRRWWVSMRCVDVPATPLPSTGREVGLDLGVRSEVATSDGQLVAADRPLTHSAERLALAQRALASKRRGSRRRAQAAARVGAIHRQVANQRRDFAHQLSRSLVNSYDLIVHEDLQIPNMVRRPRPRKDEDGSCRANGAKAKGGLNRSIHDAGWGQLLSFLAYKVEETGRELIAVDPRYTSQRCPSCGHVEAANRCSQAEFRCCACGHAAQADVNAAQNILRAGRARRGLVPVEA